jgi:transposase InsO family protein
MTDFDMNHLQALADQIAEGTLTLSAASGQVLDSSGQPRTISHQALTNALRRFGMNSPQLSRGRPVHSVPPTVIERIRRRFERFPVGVTRMFPSLQDCSVRTGLGLRVTRRMVEHAYDELEFWRYHLEPAKEEPERCRYEACQVNLIWHTDLHQPHDRSPGYYIAFLDDASRRIMGIEFLEHKHAAATAAALSRTILLDGAPHAIWSGNGTEFKGDFDDLLNAQRIEHVRTAAYNPEQNGKMERFWPTLERRPPGVPLHSYVDEYNNMVHFGLPINAAIPDVVVHLTPMQAYRLIPHWTPHSHRTWRINGIICPFLSGTASEDVARGAPRRHFATLKKPKKTGRRISRQ